MSTINFENVIFANNGASGRVDIGFDGQVDFKIFDLDGTQIFHTVVNSDNGTEAADEFVKRIGKFTCKSETNVREILYNACMLISDASEVYEEHITFGSKHSA